MPYFGSGIVGRACYRAMMRRWSWIVLTVTGSGAAIGWAARRIGKARKRRAVAEHESRLVDQAGWESFPASDPPSWTLGEERAD